MRRRVRIEGFKWDYKNIKIYLIKGTRKIWIFKTGDKIRKIIIQDVLNKNSVHRYDKSLEFFSKVLVYSQQKSYKEISLYSFCLYSNRSYIIVL